MRGIEVSTKNVDNYGKIGILKERSFNKMWINKG